MENQVSKNQLVVTEYAIPELNSSLGDCNIIYTCDTTWTSWGTFTLEDGRVFGLVISDVIKTDKKFYDGRKGNRI
jgi:hypothetical protein